MESIDNNLAKYQELMGRLAVFQERLRKAEKQKESVTDDIYEKVCAEYNDELRKLERELKPMRQEMKKAKDILSKKLAEIEALSKQLQEKIDELAFRHRIGEFVDTELASRAAPLKDQWEELAKRKSDLNAKLRQFSFAAEDPAEAKSDGASKVEVEIEINDEPRAERPAEPETKPAVKKQTAAGSKSKPKPEPKEAASGNGDTSKADENADRKPSGAEKERKEATKPKPASKAAKEDADKKSQDKKPDSDLVNPVEWIKEFEESAEKEKINPGARKSDGPAPASKAKITVDTLADLADPSDDVPAKSKKHSRTADAGAKAFPILIITSGPGAGKKFPVVPMTMTIGREHDNNIELKDEEIARYHARILYQDGKYLLQNLESSSGTWLNDEQIKEATLEHGDKIRLGNTELLIDFD